nr:MAG TPA: hypothetical protein [Caudoviricetes sp.]
MLYRIIRIILINEYIKILSFQDSLITLLIWV